MATSMKYVVLMCIFASSIQFIVSSQLSEKPSCPLQSTSFVHDLQFQCPLTISLSSPTQMDGKSLEKALSYNQTNVYTAVFFYASWCPFSSSVEAKFSVLSTMFPQIKHIMVEQSSVMPSILSKYGIHSLPAILMVNGKAKMHYHGSKSLCSLVLFYKRTTGLEPVVDLTEESENYIENASESLNPWKGNSLKEIMTREPYLVFSVFFLCFKLFLYLFPDIFSGLVALWITWMPHLNLRIFWESSQLLGRIPQLIDLKKVWSKLNLCKARNLHNRARNAGVWASSLASVALGDTSSVKPVASGSS